MTAHDLPPGRLLDAQATPPALRDALQALRERAPSAEAAARIEQRLGQPMHAASRAPWSLIALGMVALFGAVGIWVWPEHPAIQPPRSGSLSEAPALPLPAALEPPALPAHAPRALPAANTEIEIPATPSLDLPVPVPVPVPLPAPTLAASSRAPKRAKAPTPQPTALAAQPSAPTDAPAITAPAPPEAPARNLTAPPEDAERVFADPQDEAGLLYRARRLSSSDPSAALRLLVLHEASFPEGAFVQERDMLEIQIHERLGRAATAKRLAALFKQRYPESVYRVSP